MLHFREDGSGPALVFLHGFCEDLRIWNDYLPFFYAHYRVIRIDLPGFGKSPVQAPSLSIWAQSVLDTLDALAISRFSLIGHSLGGYVSLAIAEKAPSRIESLSLFHSTALADTEEKKGNRLKQIRFVEDHGVRKLVQQLVPGLFKDGDSGPGFQTAMAIGNTQNQEGIVSALLAMKERPDTQHVLQNAQFPVLLFSGRYDALLPLKDQALLASLPSICAFSVLKNSGHMGMMEEQGDAQTKMLHFFQRFISY